MSNLLHEAQPSRCMLEVWSVENIIETNRTYTFIIISYFKFFVPFPFYRHHLI